MSIVTEHRGLRTARYLAWLPILAATFASIAPAASAQTGKVGAEFLPTDAMAMVVVRPADVLSSETLKWYPTEIADAWFLENVGVRLSKIDSVRFVIAAPAGNDALFAAVVRFNEPTEASKLSPQFVGDRVDIDGHAAFRLKRPSGVVMHQLEPSIVVVASAGYLDHVIEAKSDQPRGPLSELAASTTTRGELMVLFAVGPVRPLIEAVVGSVAEQLPPPLFEFTKIPSLLDSVRLSINLENREQGVEFALRGVDDDSAQALAEMIENGLQMARQFAVAQASLQMQGDGKVGQAFAEYADRVADRVVKSLTPKRKGQELTITAPIDYGLASQPMMLAGIFPFLGGAQAAADDQRTRNNLKQIGLAMHNHHAAFQELPQHAIRDDDDTPLLSWRVKILPFIEEQALYERFRLEEPWDSEHNLKLLDEMPDVYRHPDIEAKVGFTVYQAPLHDQTMFPTQGRRLFRDVLDGLSNTIMIVESDAAHTVPWTKPADWEVDLEEPFAGLNVAPDGSLNILMADGATIRINHEIGEETMRALLTISGAEVTP